MVVTKSKDLAAKKAEQTPAKRTVPARGAANKKKEVVEEKKKENEPKKGTAESTVDNEEVQAEEQTKIEDSAECVEDDVAENAEGDAEVAEEIPDDGEDGEDAEGENGAVEEEACGKEVEGEEHEDDDEDLEDQEEGAEEKPKDDEEKAEEEEEEVPFHFEEELKKQVTLSDGTEEPMFSRGPKYPNGVWPINCHLCRFGSIPDEEGLKKHVSLRKHKRKLKVKPLRAKYVVPYYQQPHEDLGMTTPIKILPGESIEEIGEKYKDRLLNPDEKKVAQDKIHVYNKTSPIMGLCYAAKLSEPHTTYSQYYCALCQTKIPGEGYQHFVGANHQAKYIIKHFPKMYEKVVKGLASVKNTTLQTKMVRNIFRKIYRKIENAKGLRTISYVYSANFNNFRRKRVSKLLKANHYDENTIPIQDSEVKALIRKSIRGIPFIKPDVISLNKPDAGGKKDTVVPTKGDRKRPRDKTPPPRSRRNAPPPAPPAPLVSSEPLAKNRRKERFNDDPQDWERYRTMIGTVLDELDKVYEDYKKTPESHPQYDAEWRQFWRRRSKELERDNINPRNYNFNKEWIPFWLRRLRELHAKDIVRRKFEMKRTLRLSFDARSPSPIRQRKRPRRSPSPPPPRRSSGNNNRYRGGDRQSRNLLDDVALAPSEPLSVISVMRLLTALEDQLGSLGPKAVQLLSRAVLFEKSNQNPNQLLLENDFHVFFMTAKEKLKGQLFANLVEGNKIQAVKNAVNDLSSILRMFEEQTGGHNNQRNDFGNFGGNAGYNDNNRNQFSSNNHFGGGQNQFGSNLPTSFNSGGQGGIWQRGDSSSSGGFGFNRGGSSSSLSGGFGGNNTFGTGNFGTNRSSDFGRNLSRY